MKVYIQKYDEQKDIKFAGTAKKLMEKLNINPVTVLVVKDEKIVLEDEKLKNKDSVKILSIVSGG